MTDQKARVALGDEPTAEPPGGERRARRLAIRNAGAVAYNHQRGNIGWTNGFFEC
jgi:hypothetical protein